MKPLGVKLWSLVGSSFEIGCQHGQILRAEIHENYHFYTRVLLKNHQFAFREFGIAYLDKIQQFFTDLHEEICGIAEGSGMEPWQIGLLNARTELFLSDLSAPLPGECTSMYLKDQGLLGQTWDWMKDLEKNFTVFKIQKTGKPELIVLTEPGIIGKIGMNGNLGVCLNILIGKLSHVGLPIHVLCRAVLECQSLEAVQELLGRVEVGTCSHLLIADRVRCLSIEIADHLIRTMDYGAGPVAHTNHYLAMEPDPETVDPGREGSDIRLNRIRELVAGENPSTLADVRRLLLDDQNGDFAICREYQPFLGQTIGTVALILMDLKQKEFHFSTGAPREHGMQKVSLG